MGTKEEFYNFYYPNEASPIKSVTAEITSPSILSFINSILHEYYNDIPCIILMENLSEYFDPETLKKIIISFKSKHGNNRVILDCILPEEITSPTYKRPI